MWDITPRTQLTGTVTALSAQYMDNDEPNTLGTQIPAFVVADLKLAHDFKWGRIAATANNLFNEKYYTYAVRSAFVADRYSVYPLPGRRSLSPRNSGLTEPRSILVVSLRYLGDVLLTTPLIGSLRAAWPAAAIDTLVLAGAEGALEGNPDVRRAIAIERGEILGLWRKLGRHYELAVIADTADRPHFCGWLAAPRRVGLLPPEASKRWWKAPLLERAVDSPEGQPRSLAYRKLAEALGIEWRPAMVAPTAHTPDGAWRELVGFDATAERFAVLHLAPRFRYKRWNTPGWHALIAWLRSQGLRVAITGGPGRTSARTRARCSRA